MNSELEQRLKELTIKTQKSVINDDLYVNISITSPQAPAVRNPIAIICVLDISGSMDTEATQGGAVESDGFSRLDLVKHSVNTIINCLSENDTLGIVTFSDAARVDLNLIEMTEANKDKASAVISNMKTQGSTNLWDGIKVGLELTKHQKCRTRNTFVVVLSDGQPNQHPPGGELATATKYIQEHPIKCSMSMFGYGYNLDTQLLAALTELGGGCFGYIPDCSMIGTIFINFLSAALSSYSPKLQASIQAKHGQVKQFNAAPNKTVANLGTIQYEVTRNLLVRFKGVPHGNQIADVNLYFVDGSRQRVAVKISSEIEGNQENVKVQRIRAQHIQMLTKTLKCAGNDLEGASNIAKKHLTEMKKVEQKIQQENQQKFIAALIKDLESTNPNEGQVMIALSSGEYWRKWGIHYFYALKIAHENEMCTNFKDPGLQLYGGELFKTLQNAMDTVFINLKPPVPSIKKYDAHGNLKVVQDMSNYYDYEGGCIYGECDVKMGDGTIRKIKQLKKGDIIQGLNGPTMIKCVIKTQVNKNIEIIKFPTGLIITKYHPVYLAGKWTFPINEAPIINMHVQAYYNFVLESGHSMIVNDIPSITLGHGFQEQVAKHAYFGTDAIIQDLSRIHGWQSGYVIVKNKEYKRDPITQEVIGMVF